MDDWEDLVPNVFSSANEKCLADFCIAAQNGDIDKMQATLDEKLIESVNQQSPKKKETALHYASCSGSFEAVKFLVERGADVNLKDIRGKHSLQLASSNGHLDLVKYLIEHNATLDVVDKYGRSCLHWASLNKFYDVVAYLLEKGVPVTYSISNNWQPLHEAVKGGDVKIAQLLIKNGAPVNTAEQIGRSRPFTPLHIAAREGNTDCLLLLLKHKAMVNAVNAGGQTPLHEAAFKGSKDCCLQLLKYGANPRAKNNLERIPLLEACNQGHMQCAILLLDAGSFIHSSDRCGETALHHLIRFNQERLTTEQLASFTDILLQYGSNVNLPGRDNETPMILANMMMDKEVVEVMHVSMERPRSLLHLAKIASRKILGWDYENVKKLQIPRVLERYLIQNSSYYSGW